MEEDSHWIYRWGIPFVPIIFVGLLCVTLYLPMQSGVAERAPVIIAVNEIKQLLLGCRAYAADNEGNYPPQLSVLYPDYVDHLPLFEGQDESGENKLPIIYYPGYTDTSPSRTPIIEYPFTFDGKKVIGYAGGHVTMEKPKVK